MHKKRIRRAGNLAASERRKTEHAMKTPKPAKKLTLSKTTVKSLTVQTGVKAGLVIKPAGTSGC